MLASTMLFHLLGLWRRGSNYLVNFTKWVIESAARIWAVVAVLSMLVAVWQGHEKNKMATYARQTKAAWDNARKDAEHARQQTETQYRTLAHVSDLTYAQGVAAGDTRLAAYIAAHRVQPGTQAHPASAAQDPNPTILAIAPDQAVVASIGDLQACNADYTYAQTAYEWTQGLARTQ